MGNQQHTTVSRMVLHLSLLLILLVLAPGTQAQSQSCPAPSQSVTPAAVVKSVVVRDQEQREAVDRSQAIATRAGSSETVSVGAGLLLYCGDIIETFDQTKVTVLFLDAPVSERDNEVIIDANAKVGISSTNSWWGKVWVKIKGAFNSNSTYVRLGATGTEYEFNVFKGEERSTVVVLEGAVHFEEGKFTLAGSSQSNNQAAQSIGPETLSPFPPFTAFAHKVSGQVQTGRAIDVRAGKVTDFSGTYHVLNDCRRTHYFEFRTSDSTKWVQLLVHKNAEIPAHVSLPVEATVRIDATQLQPGQYRADIYAICLDCKSEPGCTQAQLDWPLNITVKTNGNPTPTPTPTPLPTATPTPTVEPGSSSQEGSVGVLEELTFTRGVDRPAQARDSSVLSVLDWTNRVILTTQPTYSAQNIIPHFPTIEQRSQSFKNARQQSILRNEPGSNAILGNVYSDWDQGALAVSAYAKERAPSGSRPGTFEVDRVEAFRLTGQLALAERLLGRLSATDSQSVAALNAYGNLNLDYAEIALDQRKFDEASNRLREARRRYELALQAPQVMTGGQIGPRAGATVQTNKGETYLAEGNIAQTQNDLQEARSRYTEAARWLESIQQPNSQYPFPVTDLGRAYQGLGNVAHLEGNTSEASAAYEKAERQHLQAINAHRDFAEAYFNLGDLFDDRGDKESAKRNYWLALKARPEQPAPYYPLALLIQKENPQLAAALAATYLQLEPEVFKHGDKAENARRITQRQYVEPPARPIHGKVIPIPDGTGPTVLNVPNVLNMTRAQAISALQTAGFVPGKIDDRRNRSTDIVMKQSPSADTPAARGSAIDLVVGEGIDVPDVIDDRQQTAIRKITNKHLKVGTVDQEGSCKTVGEVIRTSPARHTKVAPDTVVNLVIASLGENPVTMPDFQGKSQNEVEATIRNLGLTRRRVKREETDQASEGTVLEQSPKRGTQFAKDCPVNVDFTVAIPIVWVYVENYVRMQLDEARRRLGNIELYANISYEESSDYNEGMVLRQDPPEGTRVRHKTAVNLVVSARQRPTDVLVPRVVGMTPRNARRTLERAGLQVGEERCIVINPNSIGRTAIIVPQVPPGTAAGTNPPEGTRVLVGTRVTLFIAQNRCGTTDGR
jgi:beta-lactam-binding protein with PASTA domain